MYKKFASAAFELASMIVSALLIVCIVFGFAVRPINVKGESMAPTLAEKDLLLVYTAEREYNYKDIVIVVEPNEQLYEPIVKRVIATEGQYVNINYDEGVVYVGDSLDSMKPLDEPYTASLTNQVPTEDRNEYPIQVPAGHYFVMGDNRNHSTDSRSYRVGFVDENYILGKAVVRFMPFGNFNIYDY